MSDPACDGRMLGQPAARLTKRQPHSVCEAPGPAVADANASGTALLSSSHNVILVRKDDNISIVRAAPPWAVSSDLTKRSHAR